MTTTDLPALTRLRVQLARAAGPRIVVAREDLEDLLAELAGRGPVADLDALTGQAPASCPTGPAPPAPPTGRPARPAVQHRRGVRHVVLAGVNLDARRLAAAAWATATDGRVEQLGPFDDLEPGPQWHQVQAALRTIERLLEDDKHG